MEKYFIHRTCTLNFEPSRGSVGRHAWQLKNGGIARIAAFYAASIHGLAGDSAYSVHERDPQNMPQILAHNPSRLEQPLAKFNSL